MTGLAMTYAGSTQDERLTVGATTARNGILGVQAEVTAGATTVYERDNQGTIVAERTPTAGDFYEITDGLGSVVALVDPAGTQRAAYGYDPYGGHATATAMNGALPPNPFRYASGELDATGLYHFGARFYDPALGRWTQQDPVNAIGDPGRGNRYSYVRDDPVNRLDLSGRSDFSDAMSAVGLTFTVAAVVVTAPEDVAVLGAAAAATGVISIACNNSDLCDG
ncbi:MAG: RHS repeat-associated core domain-containing protein [Actinobacteria bacterium]|nr:RHS repeat-associated core domain-containing protein [Actinomycetota bacterium]